MLNDVQKMTVPMSVMKAPTKVVKRLPNLLPAHMQNKEPQMPPKFEAPLTVPWIRLLWSFRAPLVVVVSS